MHCPYCKQPEPCQCGTTPATIVITPGGANTASSSIDAERGPIPALGGLPPEREWDKKLLRAARCPHGQVGFCFKCKGTQS